MAKAEDKKKAASGPALDAVPTNSELGIEIGVEQNLPFTTPFYSEEYKKKKANDDLNELLKEGWEDYGPTISQLVAMRRLDGQARALYRLLTLPIRAALSKSTFVPADGGEKEAEFIEQVFTLPPEQGGMEITFHRFMSQLLQGLFDGFAPFEQVYWQPAYGPLAGKYTLQKLAYRPADTITFVVDNSGHFEGFRQRASVNGRAIDVWIPRDRAFYYAAQEEERKFYGVSFFQSAFYHYDKKIKMYYIAHLAAQRVAVGSRVGTYPLQATTLQRQEFASNLSNLSLAQWMTIPEGFKVELLKDTGTFPFLDYINHHNSQMSKSILAQFFDKESGGGSGDAKLVSFGQPGDEMFMLMLRAIMDDIANSINHYIIPRLIDWNFPGGKYPKFQWAALSDDQKAQIYTSFDKLSTISAESQGVTPEFMRELEKHMAKEMGLEIDYEEIAREEEEEKAALEQQQELLAREASGLPTNPEDQAVADFESAAGATPAPGSGAPAPSGANVPDPEEEKIGLTSEADLIRMAHALLLKADETVALSGRRVQTAAGAQRYRSPIGTLIASGTTAGDASDGSKREITMERLLSLQRQVDAASETSNLVALTQARQELTDAVKAYAPDSGPAAMRALLTSLAAGAKK